MIIDWGQLKKDGWCIMICKGSYKNQNNVIERRVYKDTGDGTGRFYQINLKTQQELVKRFDFEVVESPETYCFHYDPNAPFPTQTKEALIAVP